MQHVLYIFSVLCFACAIHIPAAAGDADPRTLEQYQHDLREGAELLKQGNHARALARFQIAIKHRPEHADGYYWIALVYSDLENFDLAASNAEKATTLDYDMSDAWLLLGQSQMHQQKWIPARESLEQAHRLDPKNALIVFSIGRCYYHGLSNRKKATDFFKQALTLSKDSDETIRKQIEIEARFYIGVCYLEKDMPLAAISTFKEVLRRNPKHAEAWFRLGLAYRASGLYTEAVKCLQAAIHHNPEHYEAHLALGHILLRYLPDPQLARVHLSRFYKQAPKDHPWRKRIYDYYDRKAKRDQSGGSDEDAPATTSSRATPPPPPVIQ